MKQYLSMDTSFYNTPGKPTGLLAWVLSTDHKRIGLLYLSCMSVFFLAMLPNSP